MKDKLKDIIYPSIERKFRELGIWTMTSVGEEYIIFRDDDDNSHLEYSVEANRLEIDKDYFMLQYFGFNKTRDDEYYDVIKEIFFDILNDYFSKDGFPFRLDGNTRVRILNFY
jgi:uncharacterized protein YrzB (UPF0473 family)